ncbi:MAG TPA: ParB/RepB/Spo0J family partition protein [Allocoleopsis sp.]
MEYIPIKNIVPNTWNPNIMDSQTYNALRESFTEFGDIDPILVRDMGDKYQIIDGEHRYKIARELGIDKIQGIVIDASDTQAKRLTQIMNRTKGKDDPEKLMNLLDSLLQEMSEDELVKGLPYTPDSLASLINDLHKYQGLSDIIPSQEEYEREKTSEKSVKPYKQNLEKLDLSILDDDLDDDFNGDKNKIDEEPETKSMVREKLFIGFTVTSTEFGYWQDYKESVGIKNDKQAFLRLLGVD